MKYKPGCFLIAERSKPHFIPKYTHLTCTITHFLIEQTSEANLLWLCMSWWDFLVPNEEQAPTWAVGRPQAHTDSLKLVSQVGTFVWISLFYHPFTFICPSGTCCFWDFLSSIRNGLIEGLHHLCRDLHSAVGDQEDAVCLHVSLHTIMLRMKLLHPVHPSSKLFHRAPLRSSWSLFSQFLDLGTLILQYHTQTFFGCQLMSM